MVWVFREDHLSHIGSYDPILSTIDKYYKADSFSDCYMKNMSIDIYDIDWSFSCRYQAIVGTFIERQTLTAAAGTVELMSGSWMGHSSIDSSFEGTHTFLLLKSCGHMILQLFIFFKP